MMWKALQVFKILYKPYSGGTFHNTAKRIGFSNLIVIGNLKTFILMEARIKLKFYGTDNSKTDEHSLVAYSNISNEIYLAIDMGDIVPSFICLDKATAVRLVRELKKQIGNLESF